MSLLGLVDYGSSDESDNDDSQEGNKITTNSIDVSCNDNSTNIINTKLENATINVDKVLENTPVLTEKKSRLESQQDEDDDIRPSESIFSSLLPPPKDNLVGSSILEEDVPVIVNKFPIEKPPGKKRGPVQISIPSLSDFDDLDEEKDKKMTKPQPSKKLPGVLNLLPPPKDELISTAKLVPHTLTKKVMKNTLTPTQIKHQAKNRALEKTKVNSNKTKSTPMLDSDSEDEDDKKDSKDGKSIDFFSLSEPINIPLSDEIVASNMLPLEEMKNSVETTSSSNINDVEDTGTTEDGKKLISTVMNLPKDEIIQKNKAEVGPKLPVPEQEFNVDTEGNLAFDEKAIEYLCGKRGVKRKNELINEAEIIHISGEDIKPDEREWLVKALTEEPIQRPISLKVTAGGQSKKKHQITYLAEQAKAMELELKNQWASNRLNRRQAKSKYGF
ncbi:proline-rich protein PRCC [Chelonus insularis]|uniref:proline-rich protein PRCC n=1 Tax=Chelonus insularis TaxID=460826 RepID=UPI00158BDF41|nr:proline-rich protein PRCC [Chelonus insularis]XP_034940398.1 proline-rich protein PRCC [Chelonus insularis]